MGAVATPLRPLEAPEHPRPPRRIKSRKLFEPELVRDALKQSLVMLRPDIQWSNPVMFVVEIGAVLTLALHHTGARKYLSRVKFRLPTSLRWISGSS